jgi:pimeloyl-ACP methyl ester carboxylesterase
MAFSPELFVQLPNGVRLCYQTFGDPSDPAVILIAGNTCSMLDWREEMIPLFSPPGNAHYIIRYDHRDTGLSTEFPVPSTYTLSDMAGDAEGLADHLGLSAKGYHLVGASMGGPIAGIIAARKQQQVKSLTLMYTSPGMSSELPLSERAGRINMGNLPMPTGTAKDRQLYIDYAMKLYLTLLSREPDESERQRTEAMMTQVVDREMKHGTLFSKGPNHGAASFNGWPGQKMFRDVKCPTTVIQASLDQFFEPEHGEALTREIKESEYVLWEDVAHEWPERIWDRIASVFLQTWEKGEKEWEKVQRKEE